MQRDVGLRPTCDGRRQTRRTEESWNAFFRDGRHPNTHTRCGHAMTITRKGNAKAQGKLREAYLNASRARRLTSKSKPWVAAAAGICLDPNDEEMYNDESFHQGDEEMDNFFSAQDLDDSAPAASTPHCTVPLTLTPAQKERAAGNTEAALKRKRERQQQAESNRIKAEATKKRRVELEGQKRRRECCGMAEDP